MTWRRVCLFVQRTSIKFTTPELGSNVLFSRREPKAPVPSTYARRRVAESVAGMVAPHARHSPARRLNRSRVLHHVMSNVPTSRAPCVPTGVFCATRLPYSTSWYTVDPHVRYMCACAGRTSSQSSTNRSADRTRRCAVLYRPARSLLARP